VARNKSPHKKILTFQGSACRRCRCQLGRKVVRPSELRFPLIVKPLLEDRVVGIQGVRVVESDERWFERVSSSTRR